MNRRNLLAAFSAACIMMALIVPALPAGASDHQIRICHSLGNGSYTAPNPTKQQIFDPDGHGSFVAGVHPDDIVPPFDAGSQGNNSWDAYPGKNWDAEGQAIWEAGCNDAPEIPLIGFTFELTCGSIALDFTNESQFPYSVALEEGTATYNLGNAVFSTTGFSWPEDYNGGSVDVFLYIVGAEQDYVVGTGTPNFWEQNAAEATVNTDCEEPSTTTTTSSSSTTVESSTTTSTEPSSTTTNPSTTTTDPGTSSTTSSPTSTSTVPSTSTTQIAGTTVPGESTTTTVSSTSQTLPFTGPEDPLGMSPVQAVLLALGLISGGAAALIRERG